MTLLQLITRFSRTEERLALKVTNAKGNTEWPATIVSENGTWIHPNRHLYVGRVVCRKDASGRVKPRSERAVHAYQSWTQLIREEYKLVWRGPNRIVWLVGLRGEIVEEVGHIAGESYRIIAPLGRLDNPRTLARAQSIGLGS